VQARTGSLASEQLEAARRRLDSAKSNISSMQEDHKRAVQRLESELVRMQSEAASGSRPGSSGRGGRESRGGSRLGSSASGRLPGGAGGASLRPGTAGGGGGGGSPSRPGTAASGVGFGGGGGSLSRPGTAAAAAGGGGGGMRPSGNWSGSGAPEGLAVAGVWRQQQTDGSVSSQRLQLDCGDRAASAHQLATNQQQQHPEQFAEAAAAASDDDDDYEEDDAFLGPPPKLPREVVKALEVEAAERGPPRGQHAVQWRQLTALCSFSERLRRLLIKQTERSAALEVQLLHAQESELVRSQRQQKEIAEAVELDQREQLEALRGLLDALRRLRAEVDGGDDNQEEGAGGGGETAASNQQHAEPPTADQSSLVTTRPSTGKSALAQAASHVLTTLRSLAQQQAAQQQLIAARRDKAIQSDDPVQGEWVEFVHALGAPGAGAPKLVALLQLKACSEAVVRIYHRALREVEESVVAKEARLQMVARQPLHGGQQPVGSSTSCVGGSSSSSEEGPVSCLFDVLVAHYAQDGLSAGGDSASWRDPDVSSQWRVSMLQSLGKFLGGGFQF